MKDEAAGDPACPCQHLGPYCSLAPFERWFRTGVPILTYHKLGPRPAGTRLKGLYLSQRRFHKQLKELAQAGFKTISLSQGPAAPLPNQSVALTFDDGFGNALDYGLGPLAEHDFHAIQFLVAARLGQQNEWEIAEGERPAPLMDAGQVREWLAAGHEIGSHGLSHAWLTRLPLSQAAEEISASKKRLEDTFGVRVQHFCYPFGDWNRAVRDLVVAAGYSSACTTDYGINQSAGDRFTLRRLTARYPSRNLRAMWRRWVARSGVL